MDLYLERLARCPEKASDYSFVNLYGWAEEYGLEWAFGKTQVFIRQTRPEVRWWAPVGPWFEVDWPNCPWLANGLTMIRVPRLLSDHWAAVLPERVTVEETRGQWDYVYAAPELVELKGKKYHKKKNHVNAFRKSVDAVYAAMTADCVEEVSAMQARWLDWNEQADSPALLAENRAIVRVLRDFDRLPGLVGGTLRLRQAPSGDTDMIAYTTAERLTEDTLIIHFEKGKPDVKGVYQAINQEFLAHELEQDARIQFVNREQDMDEPGLKRAKESYNPVRFLEKNRVTIDPA